MGKLWDWDHIDTDFMTSGSGAGSVSGPPVIANPRPSTGAAHAGGDMMMGDNDQGTMDDMADDAQEPVWRDQKRAPVGSVVVSFDGM